MLKYHFTLQAYETAQSFARALCRTLDRAKNGVMGLRNRPNFTQAFGRRALDEHRVACKTAQNFARVLAATFYSVSCSMSRCRDTHIA